METADRSSGAFAGELKVLKRRGCTLLVVGPDAGMARCKSLLGDDDRGRERLVVDTHDDPHPGSGSVSPFVRAGVGDVRAASAASAPHGEPSLPGATDLDSVAGELIDRIDRLEAGGLEPGELRVCLGDLGVLAPDRSDSLTAFLETVTERIREAAGMGHAHLSDTSPLRATVEPLFAVTVEVRPVPGGRQQRWLLHEAGLDSGWIPIED
ncbi:MAG: hypothetical protein ABEH88_03480 [Halobacteriales archaeon]